jgi:hypothetical protein
MHRFLAMLLMVSAANSQTVLDASDRMLDPQDTKAMMAAVLAGLDASTAYFLSLGYKKTPDGEDRDVICGIVSHGGEYGFYFTVSENEATFLPRQMGSGGRDLLLQELSAIGCPLP